SRRAATAWRESRSASRWRSPEALHADLAGVAAPVLAQAALHERGGGVLQHVRIPAQQHLGRLRSNLEARRLLQPAAVRDGRLEQAAGLKIGFPAHEGHVTKLLFS